MAELLAYGAYAYTQMPLGPSWMAGCALIGAGLLRHAWRLR